MEPLIWAVEKYSKMVDLSQTILIVTKNKNGLNQYYTTEPSTMRT